MGFESSLRREGDSLESEALSMSVMKTKRKTNPNKTKLLPHSQFAVIFVVLWQGKTPAENRTLQ